MRHGLGKWGILKFTLALTFLFFEVNAREACAWQPLPELQPLDTMGIPVTASEGQLGLLQFSITPSLRQFAAAVGSEAIAKVTLPAVVGEVAPSGLLQQMQFSTAGTLTAYLASACITAGAIVALYWTKGWLVICRIIIYLLALSTMKLSVKFLFVDYNFNFPKFVTAAHFFSGAVVAFCILYLRRFSPALPPGSLRADSKQSLEASATMMQRLGVPTAREFWMMIVPISMGFAISVAANNVALLFSSAAFTEIIASTSPVASIMLIILMGMPFDMWLFGPTLLVVAGCALSTSGEVHFSGVGMACCIVSILGRALKTTLQQRIMTGESKAKFDPVTLLLWMCVPSTLVMAMWSWSVEGMAPFIMLQESARRRSLSFFLCVSCVNACILNLSNLFCVKDLGAVGIQLVAQTKSVLTVLGAVALFHEAVTPIEVVGFVGVLIGVFMFSQMENASKKTPS